MNPRKRFLEIMHFSKPDRIPLWDLEGITEGTLRVWSTQDFPVGLSPWDYFDFDGKISLQINFGPIPTFVTRLIEETDEYVTFKNSFGFKERRSKRFTIAGSGYQAYHYIDHPTKTREDWQAYKKRYNPKDIRRFPLDWGEELFEYYKSVEWPIELRMVWGPGRGPKCGYTMGVERFLLTILKDPDLIHDIMRSYADFAIGVLEEVVKAKIDLVIFMEDGLAYRHGPLISPRTYKEFWYPYQKRVIDFLRKSGVDIICHYTSGNVKALIPLMLEAGFNLFAPLEAAAGMDAMELRKEYGKRILLMGNIGRQSLMEGPKAVEKEFNAKVPLLMEEGGYIPAVDDMILPDISFDSYKRYISLIKNFRID